MKTSSCRNCGYPIAVTFAGRWQHITGNDTWDGCRYAAVWGRKMKESEAIYQYGKSQAEFDESYHVAEILSHYEV